MSGFRVSEVSPVNPDMFTDTDLMPRYATDRSEPEFAHKTDCVDLHLDKDSENVLVHVPRTA